MFKMDCTLVYDGTLQCLFLLQQATDLEDFKTSDVQHTDEECTSFFGLQGFVDSVNKPQEHPFIDAFAKSTNGVIDLYNTTGV